jgi:hypothetical protein
MMDLRLKRLTSAFYLVGMFITGIASLLHLNSTYRRVSNADTQSVVNAAYTTEPVKSSYNGRKNT